MAGDQGLLQGKGGIDLSPELVGLLVKLEDLLLQVDMRGGEERQFLDLLLELGDGFLKSRYSWANSFSWRRERL